MIDISKFTLLNVPPTIIYVPNFISENEEEYVMSKVNSAPKPKWVQLSNRRLQNWGGTPQAKGMITESIPDWLQVFVDKVNNAKIFDDEVNANHVLVNEYLPGQGIMPHEDGPIFYPTIATISCGSGTVLHFDKKCQESVSKTSSNEQKPIDLYLERRSLVVVKNEMYLNYLHSIQEKKEDEVNSCISNINSIQVPSGVIDRDTRISLTIRNVLKTSKIKLKFLKSYFGCYEFFVCKGKHLIQSGTRSIFNLFC